MKKTIGLVILTFSCNYTNADNYVEDELLGIYGSEDFISIATGYKQPVEKAPAVASLIDSQQIRRMGANDLDDVLEAVPGLHVSKNYQGYFPIYTFRGIYSGFNPQVLLLIDGVPQTNLFTGGKNFVWAGMPVEAIDRVEIIRGPGSAIYGADAFSGVINVITRGGNDHLEGNEIGVKYGSFNNKVVYGNIQKSWEKSSLSLTAEYQNTDGSKELVSSDFQNILDNITSTSASLAPGPLSLSKDNLDINLDYRFSDLTIKGYFQARRNMGVGAGIAQALDNTSRYKSDRTQISIDYLLPEIVDDLEIRINGSYLDVTQEVEKDTYLFPNGSTGPFLTPVGEPIFGTFENGIIGNPEVFERHTRFNTSFHYQGFNSHNISSGIGYYYGDLYKVKEEKNFCTDPVSCQYILTSLATNRLADVSDTPFVFLQEGDRKNSYLYFQDIYSISNDWEITAGIRYDHYSGFGSTINPRLALVWSTTNDLTTKFLYGEAFRAPSFQETRAINNPAVLGNPDLDPEALKSFELVFDYRATYDLDLIFNTFYYEWDDIILFTPDSSGGTSTAQNSGKQSGYGFEFETKWEPNTELQIAANFAWQKSENKKTDHESANAPGKQLYVEATWEFLINNFLNIRTNMVFDRTRESLDPRNNIDDYIITDITYRRTNLWNKSEVALMLKNVFDEDAREPTPNGFPSPSIPDDLPLPGRTILAEYRYHF